MDDLVSRLLEAIVEAERLATEASATGAGATWLSMSCPIGQCEGHLITPAELERPHPYGFIACCYHEGGGADFPVMPHIAHNDPSSILRRCAADRRMVKLWQVFHDAGNASTDMHIAADQFLRHLAEGYNLSDHQEGEE